MSDLPGEKRSCLLSYFFKKKIKLLQPAGWQGGRRRALILSLELKKLTSPCLPCLPSFCRIKGNVKITLFVASDEPFLLQNNQSSLIIYSRIEEEFEKGRAREFETDYDL
jgi:hypothetical protein